MFDDLNIDVSIDLEEIPDEEVSEEIDINDLAISVFNEIQEEKLKNLYSIGKGIRNIRVIPLCDKYGIAYYYTDGMLYFILKIKEASWL